MVNPHTAKGFCQVKKHPKIREKLGIGWVGQDSNRIFFIEILYFFVFLCRFVVVDVSKNG